MKIFDFSEKVFLLELEPLRSNLLANHIETSSHFFLNIEIGKTMISFQNEKPSPAEEDTIIKIKDLVKKSIFPIRCVMSGTVSVDTRKFEMVPTEIHFN